jgi:K+ transporter
MKIMGGIMIEFIDGGWWAPILMAGVLVCIMIWAWSDRELGEKPGGRDEV